MPARRRTARTSRSAGHRRAEQFCARQVDGGGRVGVRNNGVDIERSELNVSAVAGVLFRGDIRMRGRQMTQQRRSRRRRAAVSALAPALLVLAACGGAANEVRAVDGAPPESDARPSPSASASPVSSNSGDRSPHSTSFPTEPPFVIEPERPCNDTGRATGSMFSAASCAAGFREGQVLCTELRGHSTRDGLGPGLRRRALPRGQDRSSLPERCGPGGLACVETSERRLQRGRPHAERLVDAPPGRREGQCRRAGGLPNHRQAALRPKPLRSTLGGASAQHVTRCASRRSRCAVAA